MKLETERIRLELEEQKRLEEEQRREQESPQAALEESRLEQERVEESRQESLRVEEHRRIALEEAGRVAQQKLIEEEKKREARRLEAESRQAEQLRSGKTDARTMELIMGLNKDLINSKREEETIGKGINGYPEIGCQISLLIHNNLLRYSGIILLVEGESITLKSVLSHGTEGRHLKFVPPQPEKEIVGDKKTVIQQMRFSKSDIKDLHVHNRPAAVLSHEAETAAKDLEIADLKRQLLISKINTSTPISTIAELPIGTECCICLDGPRTIVLLPCKHLCLCKKCYAKSAILTCPICATVVVDMMDIVPSG